MEAQLAPEWRVGLDHHLQSADSLADRHPHGNKRSCGGDKSMQNARVCVYKVWTNGSHSHEFEQDTTVEKLERLHYCGCLLRI